MSLKKVNWTNTDDHGLTRTGGNEEYMGKMAKKSGCDGSRNQVAEPIKLRFGEGQIKVIAGRYGDVEVDEKVMGLFEGIQGRGYLTKEELWKVARWKAARSAGNVDKNGEKYVEEITKFTLATGDERSRIEALTLLDGVSWPTASVILHLYHRDKYPILDFRALWSCGLEVPNQYKYSFWRGYVEFCREVSVRNKVTMRDLDRALWQYSKENQK